MTATRDAEGPGGAPARLPRASMSRSVYCLLHSIANLPLALRLVLLGAAVLYATGLSWGLPASDGWDVDGVAPRDVFPGLVETFAPGHFYTYPPLHLAILAVLTLPVLVAAIAVAGVLSVPAVLGVVLAPPYMTAIAMTSRIVTVVMALGVVVTMAEIAGEIGPPERRRGAATAAAIVAATGTPFTYYAHVTNLDVPYLFWAALALLCMVRAVSRGEPRRLRAAAIFAALAMTTKDQACAMFLLSAPLTVGAWSIVDPLRAKCIAKEALIGAALAVAIVLLVDGAAINPRGFIARVAFLTGSASQDFATYSRDTVGRLFVLVDTTKELGRHYLAPLATLVIAGLGVMLHETRGRTPSQNVAALVPLAAAVSFTLCFNVLARRVEERFTLPQSLGLSVYAGIGLERVFAAFGARRSLWRWSGHVAAIGAVGAALWGSVRVDAMLLGDPRYDAETWLRTNVRPGDLIEVHGLNVYLVRFWPGARVVRVDPSPAMHRNPMPGIDEITAPVSDIERRRPRFVVENECYIWRYRDRDLRGDEGRVIPPTQNQDAMNADATQFYRRLFHHVLPYHLAHTSQFVPTLFPRLELHASLSCGVFVFERDQEPGA